MLPWGEMGCLSPSCHQEHSPLGSLEDLEDTEELSEHCLNYYCSGIIPGVLLDVNTESQCMGVMGEQVRTELLLGPPTWGMKNAKQRSRKVVRNRVFAFLAKGL